MTTPTSSREQAETEDLLRAALAAQTRVAPPLPDMTALRRRAAVDERRRPPVVRGIAVAAVVAAVLAGGAYVALPDAPPAAGPSVALDLAGGAPQVLRQVARVAETSPMIVPPRTDQFVYTKRIGEGVPNGSPADYSGPLQRSELEVWLPEDPTVAGLGIYDGDRVVLDPDPADTADERYAPTTYAEIAALPTDPAAMRAYLDELTGGRPFRAAESLLGPTIVPPAVASAIYRALADVPGLTVQDGAVDAAGRPGVSVGQTDDTGFRRELVFSSDGVLLGQRGTWTRDHTPSEPGLPSGRAGQVVYSYATVEQGVVDALEQRPS